MQAVRSHVGGRGVSDERCARCGHPRGNDGHPNFMDCIHLAPHGRGRWPTLYTTPYDCDCPAFVPEKEESEP